MCQQAQMVYPHASATPPAYVYNNNLCDRLGDYIGNHILDVINEGGGVLIYTTPFRYK